MHKKFCGRGMGPSTRLENHGCEVTWVWHYGSRKCRGMCHVAHVDVGTGGTDLRLLEARGINLAYVKNSGVADAHVSMLGYRGTVVKYQEPRMSSCTRGCRYVQAQK